MTQLTRFSSTLLVLFNFLESPSRFVEAQISYCSMEDGHTWTCIYFP